MKASDKQVGGAHYKDLPIQPIQYIRENKLGWYEGNIVKYATRHQDKNGRQDVEKIIHYAELLLEEYDNNERRTTPACEDDGIESSFGTLFERAAAEGTVRPDFGH